jgi:prephenate dehydrogenase
MKVFVQGMGLMGASLALRLKELGHEVAGSVRSEGSRKLLKSRGLPEVILAGEFAPEHLIGTDLLVLGLNISDCLPAIDAAMAIPELRESLVVIDMCSTKQQICDHVAQHHPQARFVGTHPMAGKETQGPAAADALLFENCTVYITPAVSSSDRLIQDTAMVAEFWRSVGARTCTIGALDHDRTMAYVSHGLHLAACLIARMSGEAAGSPDTPSPAAGSYRDMTRIAMSSGAMWQDIVMSNRENVVHWLKQLSSETNLLAEVLESGKADIVSLFSDAATARARVMRT